MQPARGGGGFVALPELSAFDYLTLRRDVTVGRLVSAEVRDFVSEDLARAGRSSRPCASISRRT